MSPSRYWTFTLNNYSEEHENQLSELGNSERVRYLVYGREIAPTTLTPHLQGFIVFKKPVRITGVMKEIPGAHVDRRYAKSTNLQAAEYCKKSGDYVEFGTLSEQGKRNDLLKICDEIKEGATLKDVADRYPDTYIRNYRGIANFKNLQTENYTPASTRGLWYVGPPGTGKSRKAREENPEAYLKSQNKWWDGYAGEKVVIFDDLDKGGIGLGHLLKIWTDRYPCSGEVKGGTVKLQHETLIVTSNYTIDQLWGDDPEMCAAIKRRFIETRFGENPGPMSPWFNP